MEPVEYNVNNDGKNVALHLKVNALSGGSITPNVTLYQKEKTVLVPTEESSDKDYFFSLGKANKLALCMVNVRLVFDVTAMKPLQRKQYFKELTVEYLFSGGKNKQAFSLLTTDIKVKSENGTWIMIIKDIMFSF
jgi:hypothetical protein